MATTKCSSASHEALKRDPSRWDAETCNRRSQAMMIPGTDIAECRACNSSLTLVVNQAAYDAWDAEMACWDDATKPGVETPPCPVRDDVSARVGFVAARSAA